MESVEDILDFSTTQFLEGVFLFCPLVALPFFLQRSYYLTLRISLLFCVTHFLIFAVKRALRTQHPKLLKFSWLISFITIFTLGTFGEPVIPKFIEILYANIIKLSVFVYVIFEAVQIVKIVTNASKAFVYNIEEHPTLVKSILSFASIFSYLLTGFILFELFTDELGNLVTSSWLSVVCVSILGMTALNLFIDAGVISDAAVLSLYLAYLTRLIVIQNLDTPLSSLEQEPLWIFKMFESGLFKVYSPVDSLVGLLLCFVCLLTLPYLGFRLHSYYNLHYSDSIDNYYDYVHNQNDFDNLSPAAIVNKLDNAMLNSEDDIISEFLDSKFNLFGVFGITVFTYLLLVATGNSADVGSSWRVAQSVLCMVSYLYHLQVTTAEIS